MDIHVSAVSKLPKKGPPNLSSIIWNYIYNPFCFHWNVSVSPSREPDQASSTSAMALQRQLLKKALGQAQPTLRPHFQKLSISSLSSSSSSPSPSAEFPPVLPPFHYQPKPYNGPLAEEVIQKRKRFLGPSLFHYYQKPVSLFFIIYIYIRVCV